MKSCGCPFSGLYAGKTGIDFGKKQKIWQQIYTKRANVIE